MNVNLVLFKKDGSQATFPLPDGVTVLGRSHGCELRIPLKVVSRKHCQLSPNKESVKIQDLDSRIGTFLNGKRINAATVKAGDYIKIGPVTFSLQIDGEPKEAVPPKAAPKKPQKPKTAAKKAADSFPEIELDGSDSFLAELDDL
jgi:pSer/pThr/pTyr-binding forkhead associated (FHA) protein